jgi:predicted AlkP superfamily phosphohydrolase/phosphomutase
MRVSRFALVLAISVVSCHRTSPPSATKKLVVIGVDGMDPGFVERHWDSLPNLRKLRDTGGFQRLKTTTPPQSPVAWSTFITGLDPQGHGIYDFVHRDPKTYAPYSSMDRTEEPKLQLSIGSWLIPLSKARVVSLRRGTPFWKVLADCGVPVTMLRVPTNYPPVEAGKALAGMGVPDLRGGFGTFTLYTDDPEEITRNVAGGRIVRVTLDNGHAMLPVDGPPNSLRRDQRVSTVPIVVDVDPGTKAARITAGSVSAIVRQGEWSEWLAMRFPLIPHVTDVRGMVRIYAKQLAPQFQLYVTPVNIDPRSPALPISTPADFAGAIASEIGPYYTQGIAEDTAALRQGVFNLAEFVEQSRLVLEDEHRLLRNSLLHYGGGLLFLYFSAIDQSSHVLWARHEPELAGVYRKIDEAVGEAMALAPDADFVVMSDHGFTRFDRSFQLNAWLAANGFLTLRNSPGSEAFADVDWSRTQAYGLGLNGLYLNLRGREGRGIVAPRERSALLERIAARLLEFRDPETAAQVVRTVAFPRESPTAPDLIVGYNPGYRASWDSALGAAAGPIVQSNLDPWVGDHCIDPEAVPGVLFSSRPLLGESPSLADLPVAILGYFGAGEARRSLFQQSRR